MMQIGKNCLSTVALFLMTFQPDSGRGAVAQSAEQPMEISPAEFPPYDMHVYNLMRVGIAAKSDFRILSQSPESLEAAKVQFRRGKLDDGIRIVKRFIDEHPLDIQQALDAMLSQWHEILTPRRYNPQEVAAKCAPIAEIARKILPDLPKTAAAGVAYKLINFATLGSPDSQAARIKALRDVIQEYSGTDAALDAELAIISASSLRLPEQIKALEDFSAKYPGTCACARALSLKANFLAHNSIVRTEDPTERFFQVFDIVKTLESNPYVKCEKLDSPSSFVSGFWAPQPLRYAPENIPRILDAYRTFIKTHAKLDEQFPLENGIGYIIKSKLGELHKLAGEDDSAIEKDLTDLEKIAPDPSAVLYLKALSYMEKMKPGVNPENAPTMRKVMDLLTGIQAQGSGLNARRALATLASLYYSQGDFTRAREAYRKYVQAYPQSSYAWVAALRIGRCDERAGALQAAIPSYLAAAEQFLSVPFARVLGHAYAGRVHEALQQFDQARGEFGKALNAWDSDFSRYSLDPAPSRDLVEDRPPKNDSEVTRQYLADRTAQLTRSAAATGMALVERGRWLLDQGKFQEAAELLEQMPKQFPDSANRSEALTLAHKARLYFAFDLANADSAAADEAAAMREFERIADQPFDLSVCTAKISLACLLAKQGKPDEAGRVLQDALRQWQAQQKAQEPSSTLEKDIKEIRNLLFRPAGDPLYDQLRDSRFPPANPPPFLLAALSLTVKFQDGSSKSVDLVQDFPGLRNVLFLNAEQQICLRDMMISLGGTKKRQPGSAMETPNQPAGDSLRILPFLNRFFQVMPAHWGGWEFLSFPTITEIEFTDKEQTKARAAVRTWNKGGNVLLEKENGKWKAKGLFNLWIT
jgi:tetratricopeptide (TPR) repeat protein